MNNMENAAADDMAALGKPPLAASPTTKPRAKPALQRMTDLFVNKYAAGQPTTLDDLHREGFSELEIEKHLIKASLQARKRINKHLHEH